MKKQILYFSAFLLAGGLLTSCDDDDNNEWWGYSPCLQIDNVADTEPFVQSGSFEALTPGATTSFTFHAAKGERLMLVAKYSYSNDLFFAPENPGIELFDQTGAARVGVIPDAVQLWDNGSRLNEAPNSGILNPGTAEQGTVNRVEGVDSQGNSYPDASEMMEISLAFDAEESLFTCTITNRSAETANETPFSTGLYAVSNVLNGKLLSEAPFFTSGQPSSDLLTALAENGDAQPLVEWLDDQTGIITTLSGALVVIYYGDKNPIYQLGARDAGLGLSQLATQGNPAQLAASLQQLPQVRRVYTSTDVVLPGKSIECFYWANPNEKIAYAVMFGYSNDWFFANGSELWALDRGNVTDRTLLLDDGTAVSQYPGAGNAQWVFGGTPIPENQPIVQVGSTYPVPDVDDLVKITMR